MFVYKGPYVYWKDKTLAPPTLVQVFTELLNPPLMVIKAIQEPFVNCFGMENQIKSREIS